MGWGGRSTCKQTLKICTHFTEILIRIKQNVVAQKEPPFSAHTKNSAILSSCDKTVPSIREVSAIMLARTPTMAAAEATLVTELLQPVRDSYSLCASSRFNLKTLVGKFDAFSVCFKY